MSETPHTLTRRQLLRAAGQASAFVATSPVVLLALSEDGATVSQVGSAPLTAVAGSDRVVMRNGRTYLDAWRGYGPKPSRPRGWRPAAPAAPPPAGPASTVRWSQVSGPGTATFADATAATTTATFPVPGEYVVRVTADNGSATATSTLVVKVEEPPPPAELEPVFTKRYALTSRFWAARAKSLITNWIPHCVAQINRTDIPAGQGDGGIDNFIEAAKALRGEPHAPHKGYIFSNAWVHQTVESICLALMVDPQGDQEIIDAQTRLRASLEDWIPKILAAQHPDGYLMTAFTLRQAPRATPPPAGGRGPWLERWSPSHRGNHEGYVAGYFIEAAINHYEMTEGKDLRLYNAARKLADCWADHLGPAPKQAWYDGHQQMEQALVRFGRFVNAIEGTPGTAAQPGDRYIALAKFLLDCRQSGSEYDQSHVPVQQQYEAVGHAVRAVYTYSGMADVAVETHDVDYQSAVKSLWDNLVHRKYYVTGGVGAVGDWEGFGPDYALPNDGYCEACASCGLIFFQWKLHLAYHDARYVDLYEQTLYNGLHGALDLTGRTFYYDNPLDANVQRTPWHVCPCCVGNIARTLLMLPTWMYSRGANVVCVNLFAGSRVAVGEVGSTEVELVQETDYPWEGAVRLTVNPKTPARFVIRLRTPVRDVSSLYRAVPKGDGLAAVAINGMPARTSEANGYVEIERTWQKGDIVTFTLPLPVQRVYGSDLIVSGDTRPSPVKNRVALRIGPLLYNIEALDQDITSALPAAAPLTREWRGNLLGGVAVITGRFADGSPMLAVPNYARYNRYPPDPPPPAAAPGTRPPDPPAKSIVWIREQ